ncbi:MAG: alpha-1,4-glucan--maltose-1-phosphate maltosyltransferase [Burkholderiaceae bacterium]|jgi:starch synthase (maltosyl-transferring)|nr:alpha-1,4-glucan--maltose-1-phosphate maltosyltransferase [Burkholderiaceae bacterium]
MATNRPPRQTTQEIPVAGRARAVIEAIAPAVDAGRFAAKRIAGDRVEVEADCFADGHDTLACRLRWRRDDEADWRESPMTPLGNDRWRGAFTVSEPGRYRYTVTAWVDHFLSWRHDFVRRTDPEDIRVAAQVGAGLIDAAAARAGGADRECLAAWARRLRVGTSLPALRAEAMDEGLAEVAMRYPDRSLATTAPTEYPLVVDCSRARFSAWYEMFPRSCGAEPGAHGTLRDCEARLEYVAKMGFDVLYLPPIHPIGRERRKGRNNALELAPADIGSPWAIGAAEGGHKALHPELGTLADFRRLVERARELGLELALDIAFQCAPDHPYVREHAEWFRWRPDGTVQYAENPPKKYQDIFPFDFESAQWAELWHELAGVLAFWIGEGVRIFRVDNPHTKPFAFWEWAIDRVKREHPDVIFLAEAFTRPKVMHRLAKLGFTQSYTYFAWRNTKRELTEYFTDLTKGPGRDYFRPNCWPNTPDILPEYLQFGGRAAFMARLVLAATLSANYGIYGPAFELLEHLPREPGSEEYLDSEKYQLRTWDLARDDSLAEFIGRVNAARRDNPALQSDDGLEFFPVDNDEIICYAKIDAEGGSAALVVVNLDPHHTQSGWVTLDLDRLDVDAARPFQVHDALTGARFLWSGARNFVQLDPARSPAHVFRVRRRIRTERDFDYFL